MTENAGIAKLWQGFHHLTENDRDLVLAIAETVRYSTQNTQVIPEQTITDKNHVISVREKDGGYSECTKKIRRIFLFFSFFSLVSGVLCYMLFRNSDLLINDIFGIQFINIIVLDNFIFIDFIRYNFPDGLWMLSGILLLRSIWVNNQKTSQIYVCVFVLFAFLFETSQNFNIIPGTFDVLDLITMGIIALFEQIIYKINFRRKEND